MFATTIATAGLAVCYRYLSLWENTKRDRDGAESYDHAYDDDLTDTMVCLRRFRIPRLCVYVCFCRLTLGFDRTSNSDISSEDLDGGDRCLEEGIGGLRVRLVA